MLFSQITNKLKQLSLLSFASLVVFGVLATAMPARVSAEPVTVDLGDVASLVEAQYKARLAMRIMFDDSENHCFIGRDKIAKEFKNKFNENNDDNGDNLSGPWYATHEVGRVGSLFKGGGVADGEDHEIDCNTPEDMKNVFAALGYSGLADFIGDVYNCSDTSNPNACTKRGNARDIVLKHVKETKLEGGGGELRGDYTDPIRYWYWNTIYRKSACSGILSNRKERFAEEDDKHAKDLGTGKYYNVGDDGKLTGYQYVITKQPLDHAIEGLAGTAQADLGKTSECQNIAAKLTGTNAGAYVREFVIPALAAAATPEVAAKCGTSGSDINAIIQCYSDNEVGLIGSTEDDDTTSGDDGSCESQSGVTGWLLCPMLELVGGALNWVDTQLARLLEVDRNLYTDPDMYTAWSRFRNIGLALLIAAMLVMVVSTALGIGALDAYTVKKAFPRMVISVIFMVLSWYVCIFLIDLSNVVGRGTLGLMTSPFGNKAQSLTTLFQPSAGGAVLQFGGLAIGGAAIATSIVAAPAIILSYFGTGLLIMFVAFMVLVARQMFIIVLVLFSPIAILSWIFPGNDKLWKFWWQSFSKLLMMFPIIMALIASGRIFAGVLASTTQGGLQGGILQPILKFTAYVLPYAFIPFTFKAAGGIFGNLVGMANDRSRGAFDRLKNTRKGGYKQLGEKVQSGTVFKGAPKTSRRGKVNTALQTASLAGKAGLDPRYMRGRINSARTNLEGHEAAELLEKNDDVRAIINDDHLVTAMRDHKGRQAIQNYLEKTGRFSQLDPAQMAQVVSTVERAQNSGSQEVLEEVALHGLTASGTGFKSHAEMYKAISRAAGGNAVIEGRLLAKARSNSERARRPDLATPGHVEQADAMAALRNGTATDEQVNREMRKKALAAGGAHAMVSGRTDGFSDLAGDLGKDFNESSTEDDALEFASEITSLRGAMGSASPDNRKKLTELLQSAGVDLAAVNPKTGAAISTDEQLGLVLAKKFAGAGATDDQLAVLQQKYTQEIRTRAGAYDAGGGSSKTEQQQQYLAEQARLQQAQIEAQQDN